MTVFWQSCYLLAQCFAQVTSTDREGFLKELTEQRDLSLFLRLSIELLFKEAWLRDRAEFWKILGEFACQPKLPSIARIIGPAVIPELARSSSNLAPLFEDVTAQDPSKRAVAQQWIIHVVGAVLACDTIAVPTLWAQFAEKLTTLSSTPILLAVAQSLIDRLITPIIDYGSHREAAKLLNCASVNILDRLLEQTSRDTWMVSRVVTNLMDVIDSDPTGAIKALRRLITPEEIVAHGAEQGPWIARKMKKTLDLDPEFIADFYKAIFAYEETSEAQTSISGSRILALHSNRGQDYRHIYWELSQFFPTFAHRYPELACSVVATLINGYVERDHSVNDPPHFISFEIDAVEHRVKQGYSSIWDGPTVRDDVQTITSTFFRMLDRPGRGTRFQRVRPPLWLLSCSAPPSTPLRRGGCAGNFNQSSPAFAASSSSSCSRSQTLSQPPGPLNLHNASPRAAPFKPLYRTRPAAPSLPAH